MDHPQQCEVFDTLLLSELSVTLLLKRMAQ